MEIFVVDTHAAEILARISSGGRFRVVPFDFPVFERMSKLPRALEIHDRIIVATAELYGAKVITKDEQIRRIAKIHW